MGWIERAEVELIDAKGAVRVHPQRVAIPHNRARSTACFLGLVEYLRSLPCTSWYLSVASGRSSARPSGVAWNGARPTTRMVSVNGELDSAEVVDDVLVDRGVEVHLTLGAGHQIVKEGVEERRRSRARRAAPPAVRFRSGAAMSRGPYREHSLSMQVAVSFRIGPISSAVSKLTGNPSSSSCAHEAQRQRKCPAARWRLPGGCSGSSAPSSRPGDAA